MQIKKEDECGYYVEEDLFCEECFEDTKVPAQLLTKEEIGDGGKMCLYNRSRNDQMNCRV